MTETTIPSNASSSSLSSSSSVPYASSKGSSSASTSSASSIGTPIDERIKRTAELLKSDVQVKFDSECLKKRSNWSKVKKEHNLVDYGSDPSIILGDIETHSPKLNVLLKKIESLDESDMKEHATKFKHLIFTDLKSNSYGVKLIASALIATGMTLGYTAEPVTSGKKKFKKIQMTTEEELRKTKGNNFYLMSSVTVFDQPISVSTKKDILARFNERPNNVHGDNARIMVMDSGFKEGIDLFDIKYIHIFEPQSTAADQKQVIGRGTRTCGQKGLQFHPTMGWPLHVFIYDMFIPHELRRLMGDADTAFQLYLKSMNLDLRLFAFTGELERATILGSVDHDLNENIHNFSISGGAKKPKVVIHNELSPFVVRDDMPAELALAMAANLANMSKKSERMSHSELKKYIKDNFSEYKWEKAKMENLCAPKTGGYVYGGSSVITLTPTQDFLKHYFVPSNPVKGMLLWHSTGSGKTCSAIAAASNQFESEGYTILWVTRTTLKNDIWKNMFDQVCHEVIRTKLTANEIAMPSEQPKRMKLLGPSWRIRPMSYKQFSNLVSKRNQYYDTLVKLNGAADPLRKTLIIIDEAHKLYGSSDLSTIERPDMDALHKSLMNSYAVSGRNSVRLLLMTATPITTNPMEMVQLINLCKPMGEQMPIHFDDFTNKYLEPDSGKFSGPGQQQYLDDVAGYVSYLNREKDARQFSQPIIHHVNVPLVKMDDVNAFDKRALREIVKSDIMDLKKKMDDSNMAIKGELGDLDVNKFKVLKKTCEQYENIPSMEKECNKIAKKNMREIANEAKEEVKRIKEEIKEIRGSISARKLFKKENLAKILETIDANPEQYERFKDGTYYNMKTKCGKTITTVSELIKEHPSIESFIYAIEEQDHKIKEMENMLKISEESFKNKITELKKMLKTDLRDIERNVVKLVIKDTQKQAKTAKRENEKAFVEQVKIVNKTRKSMEKQKKKRIRSLTGELKQQLKEENTEKKEIEKAEKKLRKQLRAQDEYVDEIKHDMLKGLVDKHTVIMQEQLEDVKKSIEKKLADKKEKKEQKENAKKTRKAQKEAEKSAKAEAKAELNRTKKAAKTAEKVAKMEMKDAEKANKMADKANKMAEKANKMAEKANKMAAKAEMNHTKKAAKAAEKEAKAASKKTRKQQK
jgi:hypothetical protein